MSMQTRMGAVILLAAVLGSGATASADERSDAIQQVQKLLAEQRQNEQAAMACYDRARAHLERFRENRALKTELASAIAELEETRRLVKTVATFEGLNTWSSACGLLGKIYQTTGNHERAVVMYTDLLGPAKVDLHLLQRAMSYHALAKYELALADLDEALRMNPKNGRAWGVRSVVNVEMNRSADGERDFRRCHELDAEFARDKIVPMLRRAKQKLDAAPSKDVSLTPDVKSILRRFDIRGR